MAKSNHCIQITEVISYRFLKEKLQEEMAKIT